MHQGICKLSIIPVRAEPNGKSELVTQLLFGETYSCKEQLSEWIKIETESEHYSGWLNQSQFYERNDHLKYSFVLRKFPMVRATHQSSGTNIYLLPGSIIHNFEPTVEGGFFYINNEKFFAPIKPEDLNNLPLAELESYAFQFLNAPYLWGGKSLFGIDCSGYVQLLFKLLGIVLPRDASKQAEEGEMITFVNEIKLGDLAFFENENGRITHVGMILRPGEILHASGQVRRDELDSYGIYNKNLGKHTHKLRFIKRIPM